jgi:hypothetical protein
MSVRKWFVSIVLMFSVAACSAATTLESAKVLAQQKLTTLLVSEKMETAKSVLTRAEKFPQGWFFEYQVSFGSKTEIITALVDDKGNVEMSREGK